MTWALDIKPTTFCGFLQAAGGVVTSSSTRPQAVEFRGHRAIFAGSVGLHHEWPARGWTPLEALDARAGRIDDGDREPRDLSTNWQRPAKAEGS